MNEHLKEHKICWSVNKELLTTYRDGSHTEEWTDGTLVWRKNGIRHREGDLPAVIYADGSPEWYENGLTHRDGDKPAYINVDGTLIWYKNGEQHRDGDRPAFIGINGVLVWYKNDKCHRACGPAVIRPNLSYEYWINGVNITTEVEAWLKTREYKVPSTPEQQVEFSLTFG